MTPTTLALDALLLAVSYLHVFLAPYTKVEESFGIHAVHDVLMYGVGPEAIKKYDHVVFPGAVPRTFVGSVLLGWVTQSVVPIASVFDTLSYKRDVQVAARLALATANVLGLVVLRRSVHRRFGALTSHLFVLLSVSQFHVSFWLGRTIPNMFALLPVNVAHAYLLDRAPNATRPSQRGVHVALGLLTFTAVVFRSEVVLLVASLALQALVSGWTSFPKLVSVGLVSGLCSVLLTVLVDSYFWSRWPLWPELYAAWFNVYEGKSSEWGVSPVHAYLTSALPKLLLTGLPLTVLGILADGRIRTLVVPSAVMVAGLSVLPHKEWRFVVYAVPVLNIAAARGARAVISLYRSRLGALAPAFVAGLLALNLGATTLSTLASVRNYPGGDAMALLHTHLTDMPHASIHLANLAAQTGATLFTQERAPPYAPFLPAPTGGNWTYDKTEHLAPGVLARGAYTHLVVEAPPDAAFARGWTELGHVRGFDGWTLDSSWAAWTKQPGVRAMSRALAEGRWPLRMAASDKLVLLARSES